MVSSIYPVIRGEHREVRAETDMSAPGGPFDSPAVIAGRMAGRMMDELTTSELQEIRANEVLYEGEVYTFAFLRADGSFELRKSCETACVSFVVER